MDVTVDPTPGNRGWRAELRFSFAGDSFIDRARSTTLALLGLSAAVGLAIVAIALNQEWPLVAGTAVPMAPGDLAEGRVAPAVALDGPVGAQGASLPEPGRRAASRESTGSAARRGADEGLGRAPADDPGTVATSEPLPSPAGPHPSPAPPPSSIPGATPPAANGSPAPPATSPSPAPEPIPEAEPEPSPIPSGGPASPNGKGNAWGRSPEKSGGSSGSVSQPPVAAAPAPIPAPSPEPGQGKALGHYK